MMYPSHFAEKTHYLCSSSYFMATLCSKLWSSVANSDYNSLDLKTTITMLSHIPSGTSTRTFLHYVQLLKHGKFLQYDYGTAQNIQRYGAIEPPEYNLTNIVAPTVFYVGDGDDFTNLEDTSTLASKLPGLQGYEIVKKPGWIHLDFAYSQHAGQEVYKDIIADMNERNVMG